MPTELEKIPGEIPSDAEDHDSAGTVDYRLMETRLNELETKLLEMRAALLDALPDIVDGATNKRLFPARILERLSSEKNLIHFFKTIGRRMDLRTVFGEDYEFIERYERLKKDHTTESSKFNLKQEALAALASSERTLRYIAKRLYVIIGGETKTQVGMEDLVSAGREGFYYAYMRYSSRRERKDHMNFLFNIARKRMIDLIRTFSPHGRRYAWHISALARHDVLYGARPVTAESYAEIEGISPEEAARRLKKFSSLGTGRMVRLDQIPEGNQESLLNLAVADPYAETPEDIVLHREKREEFARVLDAIRENLNQRDREILESWLRETKFKDIGKLHNISEARISQLMMRIRATICKVLGLSENELDFYLQRRQSRQVSIKAAS